MTVRKKKQYIGRGDVMATVLISNHIERLTNRVMMVCPHNPNMIGSALAKIAIDFDVLGWLNQVNDDQLIYAEESMEDFNTILQDLGQGHVDVIAKFRLFGLHVMHYVDDGNAVMSSASEAMFNGRMVPAPVLELSKGVKYRRKRSLILERLTKMEDAWDQFMATLKPPQNFVKLYDMFPEINPSATVQ